MRNALLRTGTSLLVIAATSCVVTTPDSDDTPDPTPELWNPPRATPLSCTQVHKGGEAGDPDLPNDPSGGTLPIANALSPSDVANLDGSGGVEQMYSTVRVESPDQLHAVLASTFQGTIIIPHDVDWDLTELTDCDGGLQIKGHIALRGERGELCSRPILRSTRLTKHDLFTVIGSDVLIEGIHFVGPMNGERTAGTMEQTSAVSVLVYNYSEQRNRNIRIRDNEMEEWTADAVEVGSRRRDEQMSDWPETMEKPTREFANDIVVEQNFLHHNSRDGGGYGVSVGNGAHASILGNVFEANRHAIASNGRPFSGYLAKFNYVQEGGFRDNGSYQQHFDVHGMGPDHYGGLAGQYYEISNNTFRGEQTYYLVKTRAALELRGRPSEGMHFLDNVLVHDDLGDAVRLKGIQGGTSAMYDFHASGNSFDVDYTKELAVGDFDGDGRSDMFLANGTAWFVSRAGVEPWQFVNASRTRIQDLGFADMNGDRVTDVVWTPSDGRLGYFPFGAGEPVWIGHSPTRASELRFGDFDGDGKMDAFRRDQAGKWWILYAGDAGWTDVGSSPIPLAELRFGKFDDVPGMDVIAAIDKGWAIRSGALGSWTVINGQVLTSLKDSVIADFDGNGRDDVAFLGLGKDWKFSREGRDLLRTLRFKMNGESDGSGFSLYVGHFLKASAKAQVLTWEYKPVPQKNRQFLIWKGFLEANQLLEHSRSTMR